MKKKYSFTLNFDFYDVQHLLPLDSIIYNLDNGTKYKINLSNPYISHFFTFFSMVENAINEVQVYSSENKKIIDNDEKLEAIKSIEYTMVKGYKKGLKYYKKELKPTLQTLYLNDAERGKKEFDFYYNQRKYSSDLSIDKPKFTVSQFLNLKFISFDYHIIYNWGFLFALHFELLNFSKSNLDLDLYTTADFSISQNTINKKINSIYKHIVFIQQKNIKDPYNLFEKDFLIVKKWFEIFEKKALDKSKVLNLKDNIIKAIEFFENRVPELKKQSYFIDFKKSFEEVKETPPKEIRFKDFFINITPQQIEDIKEKFKELKAKELAIFISLCVHNFKIIDFTPNDKTGLSCSSFTNCFENNKNYASVNKFLLANFKFTGNEADTKTIKKQLQSILKIVES